MQCKTCKVIVSTDADFCSGCGLPRPNLAIGQTTKLPASDVAPTLKGNKDSYTQRRRSINIQVACAVLLVGACFYFASPPSDETLLQQFQHHPELKQLAAMVNQDQEPFLMHNDGSRYMDEGQNTALSSSRLASYQTLLNQSGASTMFGGNEQGSVTFYYHQLISLPGLSVKSLVYSPTPPTPLTDGRTDFYKFQAESVPVRMSCSRAKLVSMQRQ